ncbi:MAG: metal ABC transporter solute-binding protein, Zn/Mn family [Alistipes indistinctus]
MPLSSIIRHLPIWPGITDCNKSHWKTKGEEPSAEHMRRIIDTARNLNLTKLFYQRQFSKSTVDALARELNIPAVPIDPLAPDVINNTLEISKLIAQP